MIRYNYKRSVFFNIMFDNIFGAKRHHRHHHHHHHEPPPRPVYRPPPPPPQKQGFQHWTLVIVMGVILLIIFIIFKLLSGVLGIGKSLIPSWLFVGSKDINKKNNYIL